MEIVQPTKPFVDMYDLVVGDENGESVGEVSFCGLSGVNYSKSPSEEEVELAVEMGVRWVTRMIQEAPALYPTMKKNMLKRMNVGLGINGLAEAMYAAGYDYDGSEESLQFVKDLAERHMFFAYKASVNMVKNGELPPVEGVDFNWLPIDTMMDILGTGWKMNWESLRGLPRGHSVLVSMQPMESSSVFFGGSNSVYPVRTKSIGKNSRRGRIRQMFLEFDEDRHLSAWDVDQITMAKYYSVIQDFTDQAISADYYFDPRKYKDQRKPISEAIREWVAQAKMGNKTMYYLNTRIDNSSSQINYASQLQPLPSFSGVTVILDDESDCEDCKM